MSELRVYYRLSDKGSTIGKPDYANLTNCLQNFLDHFPLDKIRLFADNVSDDTYNDLLKQFRQEQLTRTQLDNVRSFIYIVEQAIAESNEEDIIYFVEDDYIHAPSSMAILLEGIEISDYVTLYDNPDKYDDNSVNPLIKDGGEKTKVFLTKSSHWKLTNSTCMTFAGKMKTIKEDLQVFKSKPRDRVIPNDFKIWRTLIKRKGRKLISPLPGYCTHGLEGYISPLRDWKSYTRETTH